MMPSEEWRLDTKHVGRRVLVFDEVDSTNSLALALASDPANAGLALVARKQTAGRGQHGRDWQAPAGTSILMSALLYPPSPLRRPVLLTAWAAVSVCELILECTGLQAKIKWPNDVLLRGRKVCGILIEQRTTGPDQIATVAGIGLNVRQSAASFVAAGLTEAASLAVFSERNLDCGDLACQLLRQLDEQYEMLLHGCLATLESCWKWRLGFLGRQVTVEGVKETFAGRVLDISFAGMELELPDKKTIRLAPESIRHVREGDRSDGLGAGY